MKHRFRFVAWMMGQARPFAVSITLNTSMEALVSLCGVGIAIASKVFIDAAAAQERQEILRSGIVLAGAIVLMVSLQWLVSTCSLRTLEAVSNHMRQNLLTRLARAKWTRYNPYHSEDLLTRMTSDINITANAISNTLPGMIALGVQLLAAFTVLLVFEPMLAVLAFVLGPAAILISRFLGKRLKSMSREVQESESSYRSFLQETLQNLWIIQAFRHEQKSITRLEKLQGERLSRVIRRNRTTAGAGAVLSLGYWAGFFLAFGWGALRLSEGAITFGTLAAFIQLVEQIQSPFTGLSQTLPQFASALASTGRILEIGSLEAEEQGQAYKGEKVKCVSFENVSFQYITEGGNILDEASLRLLPGEIVALTGPSGAGKTTLVRLLLALVQPREGRILFETEKGEILPAAAATRDLISYVPQGNTLFSGTIEENLRMGCADATDEAMEAAARTACVWDWISSLPDGLKTVIGERGLGISDGQAQRLAIARALLRQAPILILDEATSELDGETEVKVLQGIREWNRAGICLIITHRPAALEICHRAVKLEQGRLTEA